MKANVPASIKSDDFAWRIETFGPGKFKPMEIPPSTFEVGSSLRKLGEEATLKMQYLEKH